MRTAILGLGLIGGSLALAIGGRGFDRDPAVRVRARALGVEVTDALADAVRDADVIVVAVPESAVVAVSLDAARAAPRAVLTDVASSKRHLPAIAEGLPDGVRLVGGHPMTGGTRGGVEAADAALFRGRPWAIVPTARSDAAAVAAVGDVARQAGALPVVLSLARHEALMTWLVRAPLAVAGALMRAAALGAGDGLATLSGPGFSDTTRLAGTRLELSEELVLADREELARALEAVMAGLDALAASLRSGDADAVRAWLAASREARAQFDRLRPDSETK